VPMHRSLRQAQARLHQSERPASYGQPVTSVQP
jgi:hypothetical protein